jgi:hypothetical protein
MSLVIPGGDDPKFVMAVDLAPVRQQGAPCLQSLLFTIYGNWEISATFATLHSKVTKSLELF